MKKVLSTLIILIITFNLFIFLHSNLTLNSEGKFIDELSNPNDGEERLITLRGDGEKLFDGTTYFEVPLGQGTVSYASLNVSVDQDDNNYPLNPVVDVGLDGDIDWQFSGIGYGSMGYQKYFSDNSVKHTAKIKSQSGGADQSSIINLPKSASIRTAEIALHGRFSEPDFDSFSYKSEHGLNGVYYVAIGDVNQDGWPDAIVTSNTQNMVVWYENDGTPRDYKWQLHEITNNLSDAHSVDVADMDNDGDLDIVATSNNYGNKYGIHLYENENITNNSYPGNGSSWISHRIDSKKNFTYSPRSLKLADLDGDGDNDTIVGSYDTGNGGVYWYENNYTKIVNGTSWNWSKYKIYHSASKNNRVTDIAVKNINYESSDRLDVVVALSGQNYAVWFENDGDPANTIGNWKRHNIASRSYTKCVEIADMDGNNKNDVIIGYSQQYGIYWHRAPDNNIKTTSSWTTSYSVDWWIWNLEDIDVGNLNNDNYPDVVSSYDNWNRGVTFYRNNNAQGTSFSRNEIDNNFQGPLGIAISNLDKDSFGRDIIVAGHQSSEVRWYRNGGGASPTWEVCSIDEATFNGPQGLFSADIDKDGMQDMILTGNSGGDVVWLEAPDDPTNTSQKWIPHIIDNNLGSAFELFVEDINGDGWLDVAVTAQYPTSMVVWYQCPANPENVLSKWNKIIVENYLYDAFGVHIADIDDDGDNDLVVTARYSNKVYWYRNNDITTPGTGDGTSLQRFTIDSSFSYAAGVWVEDIDDDSDLDVVVGSGSWSSGSGVVWFEAPANPTGSWTKHNIDTSARYIYDVHAADIDNDGNPDVIAASYYDRFLRWFEAPDNPTWTNWTGHTIWASSNYNLFAYNLWVDDIGNDGYYDVIVSRHYEYYNIQSVMWFETPDDPTNAGQWEAYTVDSYAGGPRGVFINDIDKDGIQDVLAASNSNDQVKWYKVSINYPENVSIEVDSDQVFFKSGILDINPHQTDDFATEINDYLASRQDSYSERDEYGNEFLDLRLTTRTTKAGRVTIEDVKIVYDYTAIIEEKPDGTLSWEVTDVIPPGNKGNHRVYVGFTSESPCKVKFSDLILEYNGAPEVLEIENKSILEDTYNDTLYYLVDFFSDDYRYPEQLFYGIKKWTNSEYVDVRIYNRYYLSVSSLKYPNTNWFGETEVVVYAFDHEMITTYSKPFTIKVEPVDDSPQVNKKIPNIKVLMGTTNTNIDLDKVRKPYFTDIDSEKLHFAHRKEGQYKENISINKTTENVLEISAVGGPCKNITVTVYCDDEPISNSDLDQIEANQSFEVEVVEIFDESELIKPRFRTLPDCELLEDHPGLNNWIYLPNYVDDYDDDSKNLEYSIISISNNSYLEVLIDDLLYIDIIPFFNFDGTSEINLKARDDNGNIGLGKFHIQMIPVNDAPLIEFRHPPHGSEVSSIVTISGFTEDIEGSDISVQIKIGRNIPSNPWIDVTNVKNGEWRYYFNTSDYDERSKVTITVRAFDSILYSENISMKIIVDNTLRDSDGDNYLDKMDEFPYDSKEWRDIDGDGVGNNGDVFPEEPTQWSDIDNDGYGDNPKGKGFDKFPYDPTQHKDKDGDGYGDNPNGNNPDYYPYDPAYHAEGSADSDDSGGLFKTVVEHPLLPYIVFIIILVIINVYLFTYHYMVRTGKLEARRIAKEEKLKAKKKEEAQLKETKAKLKDDVKETKEMKGSEKTPKISKPSVRPIVFYPDEHPGPGLFIMQPPDSGPGPKASGPGIARPPGPYPPGMMPPPMLPPKGMSGMRSGMKPVMPPFPPRPLPPLPGAQRTQAMQKKPGLGKAPNVKISQSVHKSNVKSEVNK